MAIREEAQSLRGAVAHVKGELEERSLNIGRMDRDNPAYKANMNKVSELAIEQSNYEQRIGALDRKLDNPQRIKLAKKDFLNLIKTAADKIRAGSAVEKDALCRILFLNLHVDNEKVPSYLWREPFASLVKANSVSSGRVEPTGLELYNSIVNGVDAYAMLNEAFEAINRYEPTSSELVLL
jgi:hypothetical protein